MVASRSLRLSIPGGADFPLAANLELPVQAPRMYAVFAPCFTCLKDAKAIVHSSRALAAAGIGVLRYDVTGIGASEGDFAATDFSSQKADLVAAADYLRRNYRAPCLILGISLGGAVALAAAPELAGVEAVATVNAPSDTVHLRELLLQRGPRILVEGSQEVSLAGRTTRIGRALVEDLPLHDIVAAAAALARPLLLCHAVDDEVVPYSHADALYRAAAPPRSLLAIADTDHLLLAGKDVPHWLGQMIATWALRHAAGS